MNKTVLRRKLLGQLLPRLGRIGLISCLREWFINTHVCDLLRSDGDPPFGSTEVSNFLAHWGVEWCPSLPHYSQGNSIAESAVK